MLEMYNELIDDLSSHWDNKNAVSPNYFTHNDLRHIYDTANEKYTGDDDYTITKLRLTNNTSCVEFSVQVGNVIIDCPAYFLSKK